MGNPKQKWTTEEEQALRDGVAKYGPGKWKCIHNDPAFSLVLHSRSNIDLKDKWRNLSAAAQGLTTRSRTPKPKPPQDTPAATPTPTLAPPINIQPPPALPIPHKPATSPVVKEEPVKDIPDPKNASRLNDAMIFEALSAAKDLNGLDIVSILGCIEKKVTIESPQYFRKQLGARLRKLVSLDRLEKVENCYYRVKNRSLVETNASNRKENRSRPLMVPAHLRISESLEEAAKTAAYKVAEAEEKTYFAALAVREAERLSKLQEESDAMLQVAQEIYDSWHNNEVLVA